MEEKHERCKNKNLARNIFEKKKTNNTLNISSE